MEQTNLPTIQKILDSPYKLSKNITSRDIYRESFKATLKDGVEVVFDVYQRLNEHSSGFSYVVFKDGGIALPAGALLDTAHDLIKDCLVDSDYPRDTVNSLFL